MLFRSMKLVVSRTGWSSELGYEIYLQDGTRGTELWDRIMAAGQEFGLKPGHTSSIRRIEGGMLSYHADMDINTNPFELGLDRVVALDEAHDFVGKSALLAIREKGVTRKQAGLTLHGAPLNAPNTTFWPVMKNGRVVGKVTSAVYSPRLKQNIALAMIDCLDHELGAQFDVEAAQGLCNANLVEMPFYDPKKNIAKS